MSSFKDIVEEGRWIKPSLFSVRSVLAVVLGIGIVQIALYWLVGMASSADGATPVPQPDTLLYCQAARRIAEGAPFSYSAGTAVSTGTTSVLHPFVLAVPYLCGCTGNSLLTAGFVLNSLFYLVFLAGWALAFRAWASRPRVGALAGVLLALFGQTAFSAFAQSDIGLLLAASGLLAAGLAYRKAALVAGVLLVSPWVRPEGMLCVFAFVFVAVCARIPRFRGDVVRRDWVWGGLALASVAGVFALNYALTGQCQFSSVAHKGHLANLPFLSAIYKTISDFLEIMKALAFGSAASMPRGLLFLPLWGGLLMGLGLVSLKVRREFRPGFAVLALALLGGVATVAQSGWQNTNMDRYLAWAMPLPVFLSAEGACALARWLPRNLARSVPAGAVLLFALLGAVADVCVYGRNCAFMEGERFFMAACEETMKPGASIGGYSGVGMAYGFSNRRFAHLSGIYSPEFGHSDETETVEDLKRNPSKRFDYWLLDTRSEFASLAESRDALFGGEVLAGPAGLSLRKADWKLFDRAAQGPEIAGRALVSRVDVGYPPDEEAAGYRSFDRYARRPFEPFLAVDDLKGARIVEAGRLIVGGDEMWVPAVPGKDLTVVMRTLPRAAASQTDGMFSDFVAGDFGRRLSLRVQVDGQEACLATVHGPTNGFADVAFEIPGARIVQSPCRISLLGDHVACGYWFFQ